MIEKNATKYIKHGIHVSQDLRYINVAIIKDMSPT